MIDQNILDREYGFLAQSGTVQTDLCSVGIPPLRTQEASRRFMDGYMEYAQGMDLRYGLVRDNARSLLARLIGGSADEIALTKNTTEGVCTLAAGYPLGPGDNVVTCDLENQSNLFPWFQNARHRGYEIRVARTQLGRITPGELEALMDEHTKIVSLSAVQAGTGYFADLKAIGDICRARGAIFAVDAIQALGRIRLDVEEMGIDYLSCGGFKGLLSGLGTGFLWCSRAIMGRISPPYIGFISAEPYFSPPQVTPDATDFHLVDGIHRLEAGTYNVHGITLMESSVGLILELGPAVIEDHVLSLERRLRDRLSAAGLDVVTPESAARLSGMVVACYPEAQFDKVAGVLKAHRINLTHRPGYLRLAFGMHNTVGDVDQIADGMDEI